MVCKRTISYLPRCINTLDQPQFTIKTATFMVNYDWTNVLYLLYVWYDPHAWQTASDKSI